VGSKLVQGSAALSRWPMDGFDGDHAHLTVPFGYWRQTSATEEDAPLRLNAGTLLSPFVQ
jgi:hypothetical protein